MTRGRVINSRAARFWGCNLCRSTEHTSARCPHRTGDPKCPECAGLPWRVAGLRCGECGLRRRDEPELHALDYAGNRGPGQTFPEGGPGHEREEFTHGTEAPAAVSELVRRPTGIGEVRERSSNVVNPFFKDETGKRYGKLAVIGRVPNVGGQARWLLRCDDCHGEIRVSGHSLRHSVRVRGGPQCPGCAKGRKARSA